MHGMNIIIKNTQPYPAPEYCNQRNSSAHLLTRFELAAPYCCSILSCYTE